MSGVVAVIPARIGSTRLAEKPLLRATGKYLIQHVFERVAKARRIDRMVVATDDERIAAAVRSFGGEALMTSPAHQSGTDRVAEVARGLPADGYLNVQGDEPEVDPGDLDRLADSLREPGEEMVTLAYPGAGEDAWRSPHAVNVVVDRDGFALYFSRSPLPWAESFAAARDSGCFAKHLGVYGYRRATLFRLAALPPVPLERTERLEQLRALYHGIRIRVVPSRNDSIGIDTMEDYRKFVTRMADQSEART